MFGLFKKQKPLPLPQRISPRTKRDLQATEQRKNAIIRRQVREEIWNHYGRVCHDCGDKAMLIWGVTGATWGQKHRWVLQDTYPRNAVPRCFRCHKRVQRPQNVALA